MVSGYPNVTIIEESDPKFKNNVTTLNYGGLTSWYKLKEASPYKKAW
jgi:hypothetical protein